MVETESKYRTRRSIAIICLLSILVFALFNIQQLRFDNTRLVQNNNVIDSGLYISKLDELKVSDKKSNTEYDRSNFGDGWQSIDGCDLRNLILYRDLKDVITDENCRVLSGILLDPYTGNNINFVRGETSQLVQIDHVVALSNAWVTGAENMTKAQRLEFANDPLELLAVSQKANQDKSDSDASEWLPPHKAYRCAYVARQISVKHKYQLWVTNNEKDIMLKTLTQC